MSQIKPCPFCGSEPTKGYYHPPQISCHKCHAGISIPYEVHDYCLHKNEEEYDGYESVYQAIKIWNTRTNIAESNESKEIESLKAITELAVKGFREIESSQYTLSSKVRITAVSYLNEIERLSK